MKTCTKCKQEFPKTLEYFHKKKKYLHPLCKGCAKAIKKAYYLADPEKVKASVKAWQKANPEKVKIAKRTWRKANRKKENAYNRAWQKLNLKKANAKTRKRRANRLGNGHSPYTEQQIFKTYGTNCYLCDMPINFNVSGRPGKSGYKSGLHIDHFIDIALGGPDTLENVRPSHAWCNQTKIPNLLPVDN